MFLFRSIVVMFSLLATQSFLGAGVDLLWDPPIAGTPAGYNVYRSETSGAGYQRLNSQLVPVCAYTDSTTQAGRVYFYTVRTLSQSGDESEASNELRVSTAAVNQNPTVLTNGTQSVTAGDLVHLSAQGADPDGDALSYSWRQILGPAVALSGANNSIASFTAPAVSSLIELRFTVTVSDGRGGTATAEALVFVGPRVVANNPPTAFAGPDLSVESGQQITLRGTGSDPDEDTLSFSWQQVSGLAIQRNTSADGAVISFTAPEVDSSTTFVFQLTVTDAKGASATDSVFVTVLFNNRSPVADAGADLLVEGEQQVSLQGTGSDPDGDALTFSWQQVSGSPVPRSASADGAVISFTAPEVDSTTTLVFLLTVTDAKGASATDSVSVTVLSKNRPPTADAGPDLTVESGQSITLQGTGSDPDGDTLTFSWQQISDLSVSLLKTASNAVTNFTAPEVDSTTTLIFQLTVTDSGGLSATDSVAVTVVLNNQPPTADAGPDQTVKSRSQVVVQGTGLDPEGKPLTYSWRQAAGPTVKLTGATTPELKFKAPGVTSDLVFKFEFTVVDQLGASATDETTVTVVPNRAPVVTIITDTKAQAGTEVVLTAQIQDPDGDSVDIRWEQVEGRPIDLKATNGNKASFQAPRVPTNDHVRIRAVADDGILESEAEAIVEIAPKSEPIIVPAFFPSTRQVFANTFLSFALVNLSPESDELDMVLLGEDGFETWLPEPFLLSANGQEAFLPEGGSVASAAASLLLGAQQEQVIGMFALGSRDLNALDTLPANAATSDTIYFPLYASNAKEATLLYLYNPGLEYAHVRLRLCNAFDGQLIEVAERSLHGHGTLVAAAGDLFTRAETSRDAYVELYSDLPIKGYEIQGTSQTFSSLAGQIPAQGHEMWVPHFLPRNRGGSTVLRILNNGALPASVRIDAFGDSGNKLGSAEVQVSPRQQVAKDLVQLMGQAATEASGYLRLSSHNPANPLLDIVASVSFLGDGGAFASSLPVVTQGRRMTAFPHVAQSREVGIFTGLAVLNPGSAPAKVTIQAYRPDGTASAEATVSVPPGHRLVDMLDGSIFFGPRFQQTGGHLRVFSDVDVACFVLYGNGSTFLAALEGQAIATVEPQ